MMHTFTGYRPNPPEEYKQKGITNATNAHSAETPDYQGIIFDDGTVVLRWLTLYRSHSVWYSWNDFYRVHGHPEYGTRIHFHEWPPPPHDYVQSEPFPDTDPGVYACRNCGLAEADALHSADSYKPF